MKKQMQAIRFFLLASLFITTLAVTASDNVMISKNVIQVDNPACFDEIFNYSWTAEPGAVGYILDLENTATKESYSWETTQTSVSAFGVPSGTYAVTVTAKFADTSSVIIVEDIIAH